MSLPVPLMRIRSPGRPGGDSDLRDDGVATNVERLRLVVDRFFYKNDETLNWDV